MDNVVIGVLLFALVVVAVYFVRSKFSKKEDEIPLAKEDPGSPPMRDGPIGVGGDMGELL
ncbi:MAG: hypothetical protein CMM25_02845 [Rhodospirillaceae bacterium]|nr:hypothetical protein [Rhodospirillaceae bacterium]|tara:strand:+ start:273 stop:452 length:180 start_codon:yes stop_codon:yes gene_type:complete